MGKQRFLVTGSECNPRIGRLQSLRALKAARSLVVCALLYAVVLAGGVFLVLLLSTAIGYVPYSDRPGPGWYNAHLPTLREVEFFAGWAFFFVGPFALLWGGFLFLFVRLSGWLGAPKWLLRILGGVFGTILGLLGTEAAGWYIALSAIGVYAGAVLGLAYGTILLPRFAATRAGERRAWRWIAIAGVTVVLIVEIIYPLLPDRSAQSLQVEIMRLAPGPEEITAENNRGLTTTEVEVLRSLGLRGELHGGIQSFSGGGEKQARALILFRGPISNKVVLREPKATDVVYVQEGESWNMYPTNAPTLRKTITLTNLPGDYEGLSVAIEPIVGKPTPFTWYPPIRSTQVSNR